MAIHSVQEDGKTIHLFEDHRGHEYRFKDPQTAALFEAVDKLEEGIREKYFDDDIEHKTGVALVRKMKGQLRRMSNDYDKLATIRYEGMPDRTFKRRKS